MFREASMVLSILALALIGAFGGSTARAMVSYTSTETLIVDDSSDEREEFHQTYPLPATGRVSVENLNGAVQIKVWDRDAVQVDAVKRAYRRERLDEAKIDVSTTGESIRIKTVYPDYDQNFNDDEKGRYNNPAIVDYTITVPRKARLESIELVNGSLNIDGAEGPVKASCVNGRLVARGLMGETKLSTVNGNLEATFTQLGDAGIISLGSVNGNLNLTIPSDSNAIVKASTVHGPITNDFGLDVQHGEYVGHELYGQIGKGGTRIKLDNVNGGISVKHAQDGKTVSQALGLLPDQEKVKEKVKEKIRNRAEANRAQREEETANDETQRELERAQREAQAEAARAARESQAEVQREVEQAIRDAQREIQRAQREIERETERQVREQMRLENRTGRGTGAGKGRGEGVGTTRLIDRESRTFTVTGQPRVNVVTFDGEITVHGWDKQEVMYNASKRAGDEDELKQIRIQAEQQGSTVSVIAKSDHGGSAALEVFVPRNSNLHVSTDDGRLSVQGVSGQITLRTGDGSIEVQDARGQLQLNTGDGSIRVENFDGQADAQTGDGSIALGGKFAGLSARTGDGSITLTVPSGSNFTIETNTEDITNEGLDLSEDVAPSPRMKRWRVGKGGNVFVLTTSDGKVVLRTF